MTQTQTASDTNKPLPKGWRWVRLGEVCEINPRRTDISFSDNELTSFIPMEAVNAEKGIISDIRQRPFSEAKKGYTYFEDGDVLFAKITPCMQNGKHAIAKNLINNFGFASTEFHVIRPSSETISEWIHFFVRQPSVLHDATNHFTGAVGQQRVPDDFLKFLDFPLPPVGEQQRIAGLLHNEIKAVEKARAAAQARLEAIKVMPAAFLRQVFPKQGQPLPNGWRLVRLGDVADTTSGTTPIRSNSAYYGGNIPWIKTGELRDGFIEQAEEYVTSLAIEKCSLPLLPPETLLIAMYGQGQTRGRTGLLKIQATTNQACFAILPNEKIFLPYYLQAWFRHNYLQIRAETESRGGNQPNLNGQLLKDMVIPLPSLDTQKQITELLREQIATAENLKSIAEQELQTINVLPAALLRRAFNGEI